MANRRDRDRSGWLAEAGYGIGLHWTTESLPRGGRKPLPFVEAVDRFDVARAAGQCAEAGAGWLLFTISHGRQHLPFPSATMDAVLPGRTCTRDLMGELSDALAARTIRLLFYYPSLGGDSDPEWQRASGWLYDPKGYAALQYKLVAEIGRRYGRRLAGWWVDNCYDPRCCPARWHHLHPSAGGFADLYDFRLYAAALRKGNSDRLVTFNFTGAGAWRSRLGERTVDYSAGESDHLDRVPDGLRSGEGRKRWHAYVWMDEGQRPAGVNWIHSAPGEVGLPRYATDHVIAYIRYVKQHGGAFTYGVAPYQDELVAEPTLAQLRAVRRALTSDNQGQ